MRVQIANGAASDAQGLGGDWVQMNETARALRALGIEVEVRQDPGRADIVHVFNLSYFDRCEALLAEFDPSIPLVLSPIFWDPAEFEWGARLVDTFFANPHLAAIRDQYFDRIACLETPVPAVPYGSTTTRSHPRYASWRRIVRRARMMLPSSHAEAMRLARTVGGFRYRLVPLGVRAEMFALGDAAGFKQRYGLGDFVLFGGRWCDYVKNLEMLVMALQGTGLPLCIVGAALPPEREAALRAILPAGTLVLGQMDQEALADAYAAARVVAQPSWFEVPGLVALEAASVGAANLVVSSVGGQAEYFGGQAYYVNPWDVSSIREGILAAWQAHDQDRAGRLALRRRVARLTWQHTARLTVAAYREVLATRKARRGTSAGPR